MENVIYKSTVKYLFAVIFILLFTSCAAEIEPSAANSASAIIATLMEYIFAIIVLIFCYISHLIRIAGTAGVTIALYMFVTNMNSACVNPSLLLMIGIVLIIVSLFIPIKIYQPRVIISKYAGKQKNEPVPNNKLKFLLIDLCCGLILGIILLFVEYFVFQ